MRLSLCYATQICFVLVYIGTECHMDHIKRATAQLISNVNQGTMKVCPSVKVTCSTLTSLYSLGAQFVGFYFNLH